MRETEDIMEYMEKDIINYQPGDRVEGFLLVKSCTVRTSNKGGEYASIFLGDKTAEIQAMLWDIKDQDKALIGSIVPGEVIKVRGMINEYNGNNQMKITRIRKAEPGDEFDRSKLVPSAPLDGQVMYDRIMRAAESIEDEKIRELTVTLWKRNRERLLYYPAASKNHHAIRSGLLYHVYRMLLSAEALCDIYRVIRRDYIFAGVILHDIAKIYEIESDENGVAGDYTFEGKMLGHIVQGIMMIEKTAVEIGLSEEKKTAIEHMILSHHYEPEYGSPKKPMFAEAELLHYLDIVDARMYDVEKNLRGVKPGEFSERIWSMDNRQLYKFEEDKRD